MQNYTNRLLSIDDEPRRPSERLALQVWLGERANIFRMALLQADAPPDVTAQIENVDRIMLEVFNIACATDSQEDIRYMTERCVRMLVSTWKPTRETTPVSMAGSLPMPEFDSCTRRVIQYSHLR
jgi:hypothetical protein